MINEATRKGGFFIVCLPISSLVEKPHPKPPCLNPPSGTFSKRRKKKECFIFQGREQGSTKTKDQHADGRSTAPLSFGEGGGGEVEKVSPVG